MSERASEPGDTLGDDDERNHERQRLDDVGMGWGWLLVVVLVVLGIAALARYLFFNNR